MVRSLLELPFWRRIFGGRDIFSAIGRGDLERCRELLRDDSTALRHTDQLGRTPLHVAAYERRKEIVALLLSAGADSSARDSSDATPLHWGAVGGDPEVVEALLAAGAEIDAVDAHSLRPAELAEMRGHPEIASLLRRHRRKR